MLFSKSGFGLAGVVDSHHHIFFRHPKKKTLKHKFPDFFFYKKRNKLEMRHTVYPFSLTHLPLLECPSQYKVYLHHIPFK